MSGERRHGSERKKERLRALLYLADQDTEAAELLAAHDNHYAAYHCQQAAEKLIRVLLLHHDIEPGLDHHLDVLVAKLPDDEPWKAKLALFHKYTPYATTYRYATSAGRIPISPEAAGVTSDAAHLAALIADARRQLLGD
ncbi:MAG: HEPN domain-containing protein [Acidobacteriota bacterium]